MSIEMTAPLRRKNNANFDIADGADIAGGGCVVQDIAARDALPSAVLKLWMRCIVQDIGGGVPQLQQLTQLDPPAWEEVPSGGGGGAGATTLWSASKTADDIFAEAAAIGGTLEVLIPGNSTRTLNGVRDTSGGIIFRGVGDYATLNMVAGTRLDGGASVHAEFQSLNVNTRNGLVDPGGSTPITLVLRDVFWNQSFGTSAPVFDTGASVFLIMYNSMMARAFQPLFHLRASAGMTIAAFGNTGVKPLNGVDAITGEPGATIGAFVNALSADLFGGGVVGSGLSFGYSRVGGLSFPRKNIELSGLPVPDAGNIGEALWDDADARAKISDGTVWRSIELKSTAVQTQAAPYDAAFFDFVRYDPTGGDVQVNLPDATLCPDGVVALKNVTNEAGFNGLIVPFGGQTIDGDSGLVMSGPYLCRYLRSDGANWMVG